VRRSVLAAAALAATLAGEPVSAAETAVRLEVEGAADLPFSSEVLLAAVEARLPLTRNPDPNATAVRVAPGQTSGRVVVSGSTGQQDVLVAGKEASEAARLVALAVVDVSRPLPDEPVAIARAMPPIDNAHAGAHAGRVSVAVLPGLSTGLGGREVDFEPTGELALRLGAAADASFSVAASFGFARTGAAWKDRTFTLSTFPVRLGPRWRWQRVELGAGGTARLYDTSGLDGGWGALLGGFVSVGTSGALARGWRWTAMAAGDAYRETVLFRADGQPLLTTGRFVLWLGVGARFGGGAS
jgi:hypothetical protein